MTESKKYQGEVRITREPYQIQSRLRTPAGRELTIGCNETAPPGHSFSSGGDARAFAAGHGLTVVKQFSPEPRHAAEILGPVVVVLDDSGPAREYVLRSAELIGGAYRYVPYLTTGEPPINPAHARSFPARTPAESYARAAGYTLAEPAPAEPEPTPMLVQLVQLPNTRHSGSRRNWAFARSDMYVTNTLELTPFAKLAACFEWRGQAEEWAGKKGLAVEDGFIDQSTLAKLTPKPAEPEPTPGVATRMGRDVVVERLRHKTWAVRSADPVVIPGWVKGSAFFYVAGGRGQNRTDCPAHARTFAYLGGAVQWAESLGLNVLRVLPHREPPPVSKPAEPEPKTPLSVYPLVTRPGLVVAHMTPAQAERLALLLGADGVEVQS